MYHFYTVSFLGRPPLLLVFSSLFQEYGRHYHVLSLFLFFRQLQPPEIRLKKAADDPRYKCHWVANLDSSLLCHRGVTKHGHLVVKPLFCSPRMVQVLVLSRYSWDHHDQHCLILTLQVFSLSRSSDRPVKNPGSTH